MNLFHLKLDDLVLFFGGLVRVSAILLSAPIFSHTAIPGLVKILTAFAISLALFPAAKLGGGVAIDPNDLSALFLFTVKETIVGLTIGFTAKLIFESLTFAFSFMGMQMGFAFAAYYDPSTESSTPTVAQFSVIIMTLLLLAFDGHHLIIRGIADSFQIVPLGLGSLTQVAASYLMDTGSQMFLIGLRLAAPVAIVIFVINVVFGVIAKSVPQINVIVVSFTINILVGLVVLGLMLPIFGVSMVGVIEEMMARVLGVMGYLNG